MIQRSLSARSTESRQPRASGPQLLSADIIRQHKSAPIIHSSWGYAGSQTMVKDRTNCHGPVTVSMHAPS